MKKITVLTTILACIYLNIHAQTPFPTNGLIAEHEFMDMSVLFDDIAGGDFVQSGTSLTQTNDRFGTLSAVALNNDYLSRPDLTYGNNGNIGVVTFSLWVKTSTNDANSRIIMDASNRDNTNLTFVGKQGISIGLLEGKISATLNMRLLNGSAPSVDRRASSTNNTIIADGNWHHIVVTATTSVNSITGLQRYRASLTLYVDGATTGTVHTSSQDTGLSLNSYDVSEDITLGDLTLVRANAVNRYNDEIDDFLVYNRVLSASEINSITRYNSFCVPPVPSVSTIGVNTATLAWSPNTGTYDVAYHKNSEPFSNATIVPNITGGSTVLNGLQAFTDYTFYVREQCTGGLSSWAQTSAKTLNTGVLYVNANATGDNTGGDWANAYTNLQTALANSVSNDEIWIAAGTYKPTTSGNRETSFSIVRKNNIKIYGGFFGNEASKADRVFGTNETILSGDLDGDDAGPASLNNSTRSDNSYSVISHFQVSSILTLDGLTITGGHANDLTGGDARRRTGGAYYAPSPRNLAINNCKINNNVAIAQGAGIYYRRDVNDRNPGALVITNSEFKNNVSSGFGGAMYILSVANNPVSVSVSNSLFANNMITNFSTQQGALGGSSIHCQASGGSNATITTELTNNTFVNNKDEGQASVTSTERATVALLNTGTGSVAHNATVNNCIFWGNTIPSSTLAVKPISGISFTQAAVTVANSLDRRNFIGITNKTNTVTSDPLFVNSTGGNFLLTASSPAIDAGTNTASTGSVDLLNGNRIENTTVDIGAYEFGNGTTLSISDISNAKNLNISVYPNPTHSQLNVKVENSVEVKEIKVYDLKGRKVLSSSTVNTLDVSQLLSGVYILKLETNRGIVSKRFIKK